MRHALIVLVRSGAGMLIAVDEPGCLQVDTCNISLAEMADPRVLQTLIVAETWEHEPTWPERHVAPARPCPCSCPWPCPVAPPARALSCQRVSYPYRRPSCLAGMAAGSVMVRRAATWRREDEICRLVSAMGCCARFGLPSLALGDLFVGNQLQGCRRRSNGCLLLAPGGPDGIRGGKSASNGGQI